MSSHRSLTTMLGAAALAAAVTLAPLEARAQEADPVSPTGKGIAGGALLGAEIVMIPIAIAGVDEWWPYVVFGLVGAGGGAFGGCVVEGVDGACGSFVSAEIPAEASLYMLAGGMALVIPTLVAVLNATAYDPEDETEDQDGDAKPGETVEPGEVEGTIEVEGKRRALPPPAVVGVDATGKRTRVRLGVPAVAVGPRYSEREVSMYGVEQETEVAVPLVIGRF